MKYEENFQRYLDGDADEHESVQIEEDLEKMRILSSYLDSRLDAQLFAEEEGGDQAGKDDGLSRQVSRAVGRKLRRYAIAASIIIVLVIVPLIIYGLSPLMDRVFYNPSKQVTVEAPDGNSAVVYSVFPLAMRTYMELFCADKGRADVAVRPEGYGRYSLDVRTQVNGEITHHSLELTRNHLYRLDMNWNQPDVPGNAFTYCVEEEEMYCGDSLEETASKLKDVPEALKIRAAVSFKKPKNAEELSAFMKAYDSQYLSIPFISCEKQEGIMTDGFGFCPEIIGTDLTDCYDQAKYPYLGLEEYQEGEIPAEVYTSHVESMLQYMLDSPDFLRIFDSGAPGVNLLNDAKYKTALAYVREHGVYGYGAVVNATKQELLAMLEDPSVDGAYMMDSFLDLRF